MGDLTNKERLIRLAGERAELMERIQAIDDEAAELVGPVCEALNAAVRVAVDAEDRLTSTWGHLQPLKRHAV